MRGGLFWKYAVLFVVLVGGALVASSAIELYFSYQENKAALVALQKEKAQTAAVRIEAFVREIERQTEWVTQPQLVAPAAALEQRRLDYVRLERQVPAITEISYLDPMGKEQIRISRLAPNVMGSHTDFSADPKFLDGRRGTWFGPVYFRKESEPYMPIAMPHPRGGGVTVVEVNLKFIWDVVSQIRVGKAGRAYVVDAAGTLIAHPDISLVLQKTSLASLDQVRAAVAVQGPGAVIPDVSIARNREGRQVLSAWAPIPVLGWTVLAEQPVEEAFESLRASIHRTLALLGIGVALSIVASVVLARRMVRPIRALQEGAARIGAGDLGHRLEIRTRDELGVLAGEFNRMTARLQDSYATLERRVEERTRELRDALEQQTATSEILRVISSSPTDIQPVFDAIVRHAVELCGGLFGAVGRFDGELVHLAAHHNFGPEAREIAARAYPRAATREFATGRVVLDAQVVHIPDAEGSTDVVFQRALRYRSWLGVPMLRDGRAIGSISVSSARPFSDAQIGLLQTFADQAVIAIENVRLFTELQARNRDLTTALDQQTATAEILRVISRSSTDVQPVFQAIVDSATRLLRGHSAVLSRIVDDRIDLAAYTHTGEAGDALLESLFPMPLHASGADPRPIRERVIGQRIPYNVADVETDPRVGERGRANARARGYRSQLVVPMLRDDEPIGTIAVTRADPGAFADEEIGLLQTFADQAVIAVENARLLTELQEKNQAVTEALERQTATADILAVISSSPTEAQPVFEAIVASGLKLFRGAAISIALPDGAVVRAAAIAESDSDRAAAWRNRFPFPLTREYMHGVAILDRRVVDIPDVAQAPAEWAAGRQNFLASGYRGITIMPMIRGEEAIGVLSVVRVAPGPLSDKQLAVLKTFADQAVIAIENVRLFTELEEKNRAVSEALERQTATSEILRVISRSPTDVQPVLDAVAESAARVCGANDAIVLRRDDSTIRRVAHLGDVPVVAPEAAALRPTTVVGRAILECRTIHVDDVVAAAAEYPDSIALQLGTTRTMLVCPLVREGTAIGALLLRRAEVLPFSDKQVELLETFADQAVIAIENVRLFTELQERTRELGRSVDQLTALGEVSRAVSSTLDLDRVLNTVVSRASQLAGADGCSIYEYDEKAGGFRVRATSQLSSELVETQRSAVIHAGEGAVGRLVDTREPVQIPDIAGEDAYQSPLRDVLLRAGHRALLAVPMLHEDRVVGGLVVSRKAPGEFPAETVELLKTFANQSALAIQNARLFREIEDKSGELEVANRHKSEFLASMSHELRTPLNAVIGFSEVLLERMFGELNDKQEEYLRDIYSSGRHLLSLINDILDLAKIEAGRMELEVTRFDLPQAIENAVTLVRGRADAHAIRLEMQIDPRLGDFVADERKVKQILLNLLSNAVKFTPEGGRITLRAAPANGSVEIAVADTGTGIASEDQAAVFEEFRQVGADYARKREGTGLGLALTKRFVELHGGTIGLKSALGEGSTFTFTLPVRPWPTSSS
ncbi:MAG: GAF domain-containing protein [Candidatus Rokubacteria bacterium]|nr:GAF domain-containing protein [Candidatus Rokubacteria bacterium]